MRAGAHLLLVWMLSLPAAAQTGGADIPPFPGAEVYSMGESSRVNGHELHMYYFTTPSEPGVVAEHYRQLWEAAGQLVTVQRNGSAGLSVGYVDLRDGKARSVSLWKERGLTFGFPAVLSGFPAALGTDPALAGDVPVHPRAEGVHTYDSLDSGATFRTVSYSDTAPLAENERFYLRELGARGYALTGTHRDEKGGPSVLLDFARGDRKMSVTLAWASFHGRCAVFVVTNAVEDARREEEQR